VVGTWRVYFESMLILNSNSPRRSYFRCFYIRRDVNGRLRCRRDLALRLAVRSIEDHAQPLTRTHASLPHLRCPPAPPSRPLRPDRQSPWCQVPRSFRR
jgi:hypothetical protein